MNLFPKLFTFNIYFLYIYDIKTTSTQYLYHFNKEDKKSTKLKASSDKPKKFISSEKEECTLPKCKHDVFAI